MGLNPLDRLSRRFHSALRDLDAEATISDAAKLDLLREIAYEAERRAAALEPTSETAEGAPTRWSPMFY